MKCSHCQSEQATIHLTQVVDGEIKKLHLCEECAQELGFSLDSPVSITDALLGIGEDMEIDVQPRKTESACPHCKTRHSQFKKKGRLGCPTCYAVFANEVEPVIQAMHHSQLHAGKIPAMENDALQRNTRTSSLRDRLKQAVAREAFEEAARIRDEIRRLENTTEKR